MTDQTPKRAGEIDITPTWAEWALLYIRLAETGEADACRKLRKDMIRMAHMATAFNALLKSGTLTEEQDALITPFMARING